MVRSATGQIVIGIAPPPPPPSPSFKINGIVGPNYVLPTGNLYGPTASPFEVDVSITNDGTIPYSPVVTIDVPPSADVGNLPEGNSNSTTGSAVAPSVAPGQTTTVKILLSPLLLYGAYASPIPTISVKDANGNIISSANILLAVTEKSVQEGGLPATLIGVIANSTSFDWSADNNDLQNPLNGTLYAVVKNTLGQAIVIGTSAVSMSFPDGNAASGNFWNYGGVLGGALPSGTYTVTFFVSSSGFALSTSVTITIQV